MALYNMPIYSPNDYAALQEDISTLVNWINSAFLWHCSMLCYANLERGSSLLSPMITVNGTNLAL